MPGILDMLSQTWPARLAQDVWGGITAPRDAWQGKLDALSPEGIARAGNLAGFIMGGSMAAPAQRNATGMIRAYHGSPYDFEKFDLSKIGTGEGAQAYGHGLYFAENEGVARSYRDSLSPPAITVTRQTPTAGWDMSPLHHSDPNVRAAGAFLKNTNGDVDAALAHVIERSKSAPAGYADDIIRVLNDWKQSQAKVEVNSPGRMYEVNINAKPEQFLDWDKPLAQQPQSVQQITSQIPQVARQQRFQTEFLGPDKGVTGSGIYRMASQEFPNVASETLREAGIPGIKYLDQGSRTGDAYRIAGQPPNFLDPMHVAALEVNQMGSRQAALQGLEGRGAQIGGNRVIDEALRHLHGNVDLPSVSHQPTSNYVLFRDDIIDILRKYGLIGTAAGLGATSDQLPIPSQPAPIYAQ